MNAKAYQLTLRIDLENSAFDGSRAAELARVLRSMAASLERDGDKLESRERAEGWLWDSNGNNVGNWLAAIRTYRNI